MKFRNIRTVLLLQAPFLALIGFAVWVTQSAWPLWALLLHPTLETTERTVTKKPQEKSTDDDPMERRP